MGHVVRMTLTGTAGITFVFLVDALNLLWLSLLGDPKLVAAIGFAFAIQFFSVSSGIGLMIAATVLVSREIGANHRSEARLLAGSALFIGFFVQAVMAGMIILFRYDILILAGAVGETLELAARYLLWTLPSLSVMIIGMIASGALRAEGDGKRAMFVTLSSGTVSFFLDPVLIYYLSLGLDGAAIGLNISRVILMLVALYFATCFHRLIALPSLARVTRHLWPFMAVACPAMLTQLATPFGNYLLTAALAQFGDDAVAGWAVVSRLTVLAFGGIFALSGSIGGIFGQNYGAKQYTRLVATYRNAMLFCFCYTFIVWGLLVTFSSSIAHAFGLMANGADVLRAFTHFGAGAFLFTGAYFVSNAAFNALDRPMRATLLTWIRDGLLTWPTAMWFAASFGSVGVIYAQAVLAIGIGTVSALWGWYFVRRIVTAEIAVDLVTRRGLRDVYRFQRR